MIDSTEYHEVYNTTGEILQNVQPITTSEYLLILFIFGVLFSLFKKSFFKIVAKIIQ
jgi:hypothetical protein